MKVDVKILRDNLTCKSICIIPLSLARSNPAPLPLAYDTVLMSTFMIQSDTLDRRHVVIDDGDTQANSHPLSLNEKQKQNSLKKKTQVTTGVTMSLRVR